MRVAVYVPPHTIGALCIWLSSVNIDSTIYCTYLYYTVTNEYIQSHRNRTVHV